uniref:Two-component response regulator ARR2 n=1 Tax=Cajanus cajan TaxID=3821 RepID=A0A151TFT1_CAJCA|nr:Two-component response regulator ARR2 [Cajanus cajan]
MAKLLIEEDVPFKFPAGLRVLAVDSDPAISTIIKQLCFQCIYHVITCSDTLLALNHVREKKDCFDMILIEVHMPIMDGYEFIQHVSKEINVPIIMMSLDDAPSAVMKAIEHGACDYWIKPLHENQFKIMWKHVVKKLWSENKLPKKNDSEFTSSNIDALVRYRKNSSSNSKESDADESEDCYTLLTKKPRIMWSSELHNQFVKAVMQIGVDKAKPKEILEVMQIPDMTRDHIASHLQVCFLYAFET